MNTISSLLLSRRRSTHRPDHPHRHPTAAHVAVPDPPLTAATIYCGTSEIQRDIIAKTPALRKDNAMLATETPSLPRVGLLIPSSNTVMERDLRSSLADVADLYSARMHLVETTKDAEAAMLDTHLPQAIEDIASLRPAVTVFGCTSAGALRGPDYDRDLCARIADRTQSRAVSTIASASAAISETGRNRVAVLTPYVDELNVTIQNSLSRGGLEIVDIEGFGIDACFRLAEPTPREIADRALKLIERARPEVLFISCTNFRGSTPWSGCSRRWS